jgi:penicillin-binding protein 1A
LVVRRLFVGVGLVVALLAVAVVGFVYREISSDLPPLDAAVQYQPPVTTQILADDGTVIGEFYSQKRYVVPLDRIPQHVRQAFIAAEDDAFYRHQGIDAAGIVRAFVNNIIAGGKVQGGSTITQQVVKSVLLTPQKSYERKLKEMILSMRLEQELPKDQILALYLNHIYLGSGAYGVAAAAREYFGKDIVDVNIAEAAMLAGLPQAPSRYSPYTHWPEAKARQRYVLGRMYEVGFIDRETHDAALKEPISLASRKGSFQAAPYFVEYVRHTLEERYGHTVLYELGLQVHTTVDLRLQTLAEAALREGIDALSERLGGFRAGFRNMEQEEREAYLRLQMLAFKGMDAPDPAFSYEALVTAVRGNTARVQLGPFSGDLVLPPGLNGKTPTLQLNDLIRVRVSDEEGPLRFVYDSSPMIEGALLAMDQHTGFVKAMVGGYDFDRSHFNRVIQAKRQPGSSFKPLVYAAAFDRNFTPGSVIVDEPISFNDNGRVWAPQNYEKKFFGPTSLREALTHSRNVVTVKLADRIGIKYLIDYLPRFGIPGPLPRNLSIALGTTEVTPLELADAYCTFANNGMRPEPVFITEITDPQGQVLEHSEPALAPAIPAATAFQITSILQDVVKRGTGTKADGLPQPTAGKTGTTNDFGDTWFVGFTPQLLSVVWIGFDNKRPIGNKETGGRVAAPIWKAFMEKALEGIPPGEFPIPEGLKCVNIDPNTGVRAAPGGNSRLECYRPGTEPQPGAVPAVQLVEHHESNAPSTLDFMRSDF